jgi:hypothetical protein
MKKICFVLAFFSINLAGTTLFQLIRKSDNTPVSLIIAEPANAGAEYLEIFASRLFQREVELIDHCNVDGRLVSVDFQLRYNGLS